MIFHRTSQVWTQLALLVALVVLASPGSAQPNKPGGPGEPAFMAALFPPELIMRHAREIGLTTEQRKGISRAVSETQSEVFDLQWTMQELAAALGKQLGRDPVDEEAALAAAQQVMETEFRVKRAHLRMLIRIKNSLQAGQRRQLAALRKADPEP